jgi:hypothetical protein
MTREEAVQLVEAALETRDYDMLAYEVGYCRCVFPSRCSCKKRLMDPVATEVQRLFSGPPQQLQERLRGFIDS